MTDERTSEPLDEIQGYVQRAATELVAGLGLDAVHAERQSERVDGDAVIASIGFVGDGIRGSLTLMCDGPSAEQLQDATGVTRHEDNTEALRDVLGELSNQMLGRVKNLLLTRQVVLKIALPTTAIGKDLRVIGPMRRPTEWHVLRWGATGGRLHARFDAILEDGFQLGAEVPQAAMGLMDEGEMMLF